MNRGVAQVHNITFNLVMRRVADNLGLLRLI